MKKLTILFFILSIGLAACKKDYQAPHIPVSNEKIKKLKTWFESNKKVRSGLHGRDSSETDILPEQTPIWDSTEFFASENVYTTPLLVENGSSDMTQSLVIETDAAGEVVSGQYAFIRLTDAEGNISKEDVIASYPYVFDFENMPNNFKASIIKFNIDGERISSKHFDNQVITETDESILSYERAPDEAGIEYCIDTWWVTYEDDIPVSVVFMYSNCFCVGCNPSGGSSSGGSSSNNGSCNLSPAQAQSILNSATISNPGTLTATIGSSYFQNGQERQPKNPKYEIAKINLALSPFRAPTYFANFIGVRFRTTGTVVGPWKWESLSYVNTIMDDGIIPTCTTVNFSPVVNAMIWNDRSRASLEITYTAVIAITCTGPAGPTQLGLPMTGSISAVMFP